MRIRFSKQALARLAPPSSGRLYVYDQGAPGLVLQVTPAGSCSFQLYRKLAGKPVRVTLGKFDAGIPDSVRLPEDVNAGNVAAYVATLPALNVAMARRLTELLRAAGGATPAALKRTAAGLPTVGALLDAYRALHLEPHRRPKSVENFGKSRKYLGAFEGRRVDRLDAGEIARWHATLGAAHAVTANRAVETLRASINWARKSGHLSLSVTNPAAGITRHRETSRERFLQRHEVAAFFAALGETPEPWRTLLALTLFTGQRVGAVAAMRWADIDLAGALWHLPPVSSKSGKPITVPLVSAALELLERQPRINAFVFPARSRTGHSMSPKNVWKALLARAGLINLRVHDLRRTVGSWMASSNVSLHVIGQALGHSSRDATAIYARLQHEPVRAALTQAVGELIDAGRAS